MRALMLAVVAIIASIDVAEAVTCASKSQRDGAHWSYRIVDGRQCWYRGRKRLDKDELHWTVQHPSLQPSTSRSSDGGEGKTTETATSPPISPVRAWLRHHRRPVAVAALIEWPDPPLPFTERFGDLPSARALPQHLYDELPTAFGGTAQTAFAYQPEELVEDYRAPAALMLVMVLMWLLLLPPIVLVIFILWRRRMDQIELGQPTWRVVRQWIP